jgi:endothelin-converting enzyme/putative endopeptidase
MTEILLQVIGVIAVCAPIALTQIVQNTPTRVPTNALTHFGLDNLDPKADPCVDFYQYSCGGWIAANPLPPDEVWWDTGTNLQRRNEAVLHDAIEKSSTNDPNRTAVQRKIGDYYAACMDQKQIEAEGLSPIRSELGRIAALKDKRELATELAHLHQILFLLTSYRNGYLISTIWDVGSREPLFGFSRLQDFDDSSKVVAIADQGGLGLPDRDYYLRNDKDSVTLRDKYVEHVRKVLALAADSPDSAQAATRVVEIETALARSWMDVAQRHNMQNLNHKFSLAKLQELMPAFSWSDYLHTLHAPPSEHYLVTSPEFFSTINGLLETVALEDWKIYLRWHLLQAVSPSLTSTFVSEDFEFYDKTLFGQQVQRDRWKRCLEATDRDLGDALGQEFIRLLFRHEDKEEVAKMTAMMEQILHDDIGKLDWMTPSTKREALLKLERINNRIAYPEKWQDYGTVHVTRDGWLGNAFQASEYALSRKLNQIGKPVDRNEWAINVPTVNAISSFQLVAITVPAGTLAPPVYEREMDEAVNLGGIGTYVGHELSHQFDSVGRRFDSNGNVRDWWTAEDAKLFQQKTKCVSDQYSEYTVTGGGKVDGEVTLPENLADIAGLRIALMALNRTSLPQQSGVGRDNSGFTRAQRLFLSYALTNCTNLTPEYLRDMVSNDSHSPPQFRVNGVVSNMPEFQQAFSCKKGQPMVRENACRVW